MSTRQGKYYTYTLSKLQNAALMGDKGLVRALVKQVDQGLDVSFEDKVTKVARPVNFLTKMRNTLNTGDISFGKDIKTPEEYLEYFYDYVLEDRTARAIAERIELLCVSTLNSKDEKNISHLYYSLNTILNKDVATSFSQAPKEFIESTIICMIYIKTYLIAVGAQPKKSGIFRSLLTGFPMSNHTRRKRAREFIKEENKKLGNPSARGGSRRRNARKSRKTRKTRKTRK